MVQGKLGFEIIDQKLKIVIIDRKRAKKVSRIIWMTSLYIINNQIFEALKTKTANAKKNKFNKFDKKIWKKFKIFIWSRWMPFFFRCPVDSLSKHLLWKKNLKKLDRLTLLSITKLSSFFELNDFVILLLYLDITIKWQCDNLTIFCHWFCILNQGKFLKTNLPFAMNFPWQLENCGSKMSN